MAALLIADVDALLSEDELYSARMRPDVYSAPTSAGNRDRLLTLMPSHDPRPTDAACMVEIDICLPHEMEPW